MGLDIMVAHNCFGRLLTTKNDNDEMWDREDVVYIDNLDGFADRQDGAVDGFYECDGVSWAISMSYSGYGAFREWIAQECLDMDIEEIWRNPGAAEIKISERFGEDAAGLVKLLNFADNEGAIGPRTSSVIAKAMRAREAAVKPQNPAGLSLVGGVAIMRPSDRSDTDWRYEQYHALMVSFEKASADNGFVVFA